MIKIFLTNLGKYNEGILVGKWVSLPCEDLAAELETIGVKDNTEYEEYFITDWETPIDGISISEYSSIEYLNEVAELLEDNKENIPLLECLMDEFGYSFKDAINKIDDASYMYLDENIYDEYENLAYSYIDSIGNLECAIGNKISEYFDYAAFGRDLQLDGLEIILEGMTEEDKEIYYNMCSKDLAEWYIYDCLGSIDILEQKTLETYFDYESFGRDLAMDYSINRKHMIAVACY